jgi:hypothetical protein
MKVNESLLVGIAQSIEESPAAMSIIERIMLKILLKYGVVKIKANEEAADYGTDNKRSGG